MVVALVCPSAAHAALVALAPGVLTRHHAGHYQGFTVNQWRLLEKEDVREFYLGMKSEGVRGQRRWKKKKQWR